MAKTKKVNEEYIFKMEEGVSKFLKSNLKFKNITKKEFNNIFKTSNKSLNHLFLK